MAATAAGVAGVTAEGARFSPTSTMNGKAAQCGLPSVRAGDWQAPRARRARTHAFRVGQDGISRTTRAATSDSIHTI